jgi:hypothetical protein
MSIAILVDNNSVQVGTSGNPLYVAGTVSVDTTGLATSANQAAEQALTGAVNETAPASDTASSGLNGRLQRIAQRLTSLIAQLPASLGAKAGSASLSVVPATDAAFSLATSAKASSVSLTRTNDTNAYAANDVVGAATGSTAALEFTSFGPTGGGDVMITSASLEIDVNAVPSGMTSFNLALYSVTPPSALGDNTAWDLPSGDRASYLGTISLGTPVDLGSTLFVSTDQIQRQITLAGTSLFAYLVTVGAYTPAAQTVFAVKLHGVAL